MRLKRQQKNAVQLLFIIIFFIIAAIIYIVIDKKPPSIQAPNMSFYNFKYDIPLMFEDENGIKSVEIYCNDAKLLDKSFKKQQQVKLNLPLPRNKKQSELNYKIIAKDTSLNRFGFGNKTEIELNLKIDTTPPQVKIIAMSNVITKGGSAAVVFYADDENGLGDISLSNGFQSFVAFPFYKPNYYAAILAYPIQNPSFKASISVLDKAGNAKKASINFQRYTRIYRISNIHLKGDFLENKIFEIISNENEREIESFSNDAEKFIYVNETMRKKDGKIINDKILNSKTQFNSHFSVFKPMDSARIVGLFGDYRKYFLNKISVGESYHLGIDLASSKNAPIIASNRGIVVMNKDLGLYGKTLIIDHGLGISSLYSHLETSFKEEGDIVEVGEVIAESGQSGFAFGDHLHFGILIQGNSVINDEWMNAKWVEKNTNEVFDYAVNAIEEAR